MPENFVQLGEEVIKLWILCFAAGKNKAKTAVYIEHQRAEDTPWNH